MSVMAFLQFRGTRPGYTLYTQSLQKALNASRLTTTVKARDMVLICRRMVSPQNRFLRHTKPTFIVLGSRPIMAAKHSAKGQRPLLVDPCNVLA